jgi:hypothetical protein
MATMDDFSKLVDAATYIPQQPFTITTSLFLSLALLGAIIHFVFRLRQSKTLHLDSLILLFAISCLIGGTASIHLGLSDIYLATAIIANPSLIPSPPTLDMIDTTSDALRSSDAFHSLVWTSIFAVKISFICFFRQLTGGGSMMRKGVKPYWWGVLVVVVVGWAVVLCIPFISCSHRGGEAGTCNLPLPLICISILKLTLNLALYCGAKKSLSYTNAAIDCLTTILILSLPALLTRTLPTPTTRLQKVILLTLTTVLFTTIILSITRAIIHTQDTPFQAYLVYLEACLFILAVSLTTVKDFFSAHPHPHSQQQDGTQLRWRPGTLTRRRRTESQDNLQQLQTTTLPSDNALPGLSTFIKGGTARTPSRLKKTSLRRKESVLRTREVVVEVHYEKDLEKGDWDRIANPTWMDEQWKTRRSSEDSTLGT